MEWFIHFLPSNPREKCKSHRNYQLLLPEFSFENQDNAKSIAKPIKLHWRLFLNRPQIILQRKLRVENPVKPIELNHQKRFISK